jgi:purine-binding chemotaxis protein CheW
MASEQFVEIQIGQEMYALPILDIFEIIRMQDITRLPNSKKNVIGVINLRGRIISVVSLRQLLGLTDLEYTKSTRIVVVNYHDDMAAMIVDGVSQVITISEIQPAPENSGAKKLLRGIGQTGNSLVSILDLEKLLQESFG